MGDRGTLLTSVDQCEMSVNPNPKCAYCRTDHGRPLRGYQDESDVLLCSACDTYYKANGVHRPPDLWPNPVRPRNRKSGVSRTDKVTIKPVRHRNGKSRGPRMDKAICVDAGIQTDDMMHRLSLLSNCILPCLRSWTDWGSCTFQPVRPISTINTGIEDMDVLDYDPFFCDMQLQ